MVGSEADLLPCANKRSYKGRKRAAQAASFLKKRIADARGEEPIHYYHCEYCGDWHVGHPRGWRKENNRPRPMVRTTI